MAMEMHKRTLQFKMEAPQTDKIFDSEYYVEGYATTWDRYELYSGDNPIYERIDKSAFDGLDMSDVIFLYNHEGMILARTLNKTLFLRIDDHGLFIACDLSKTSDARNLYEAIACGNVTQMSWAFMTNPDEDETFNTLTRTIEVLKIRRIVDVSAVSIPANSFTEISARCKQFEEAEEKAQQKLREIQEKKEREKAQKKLKLLLKLGGH